MQPHPRLGIPGRRRWQNHISVYVTRGDSWRRLAAKGRERDIGEMGLYMEDRRALESDEDKDKASSERF